MLTRLIDELALDEREGVPADVPINSPVEPGVEAMTDDEERENVRRGSISSLFRCTDDNARSETEWRFMVRRTGLQEIRGRE